MATDQAAHLVKTRLSFVDSSTPISFSLAIPQSASCQMPRIKEICTVMDIPGITCPSNKSSLDARNEAREPGKRRRSRNLAIRRHRRSMSRRLLQEINGAGLEEIAMVASRLGSCLGGPKHFSCLTDPLMVVLHTLAETVETDSVRSPDPLAAAALPLEPNKPRLHCPSCQSMRESTAHKHYNPKADGAAR